MNYRDLITVEPGKRSGKPCIRGMRKTVTHVLECLASGMSAEEILTDFPELMGKAISRRAPRAGSQPPVRVPVPRPPADPRFSNLLLPRPAAGDQRPSNTSGPRKLYGR